MSKIKTGLVQINNSFANACYFPYSVGLFQTYFQKHGKHPERFEFMKPIYRRLPVEEGAESLSGADVAAFSVYVWSFRLSLAIAERLRAVSPETMIIFGGPHVPDRSEPFLRKNPFIDIACHGEGERTFCAILDEFESRRLDSVRSISYLKDGRYVKNSRYKRISGLDTIPSPYLEGLFDDLMNNNPEEEWLVLWETNRGCPFSCAFCDWGSATTQKIYPFSLERLKQEIDWFAEKKIEFIFCCDANFGIQPRDIDLVEYIIETKERTGFPKALSVQSTKNATERSYNIQAMLSEAGLNKGVTMALQTVDKETLKNVGRQNISLKSYEEMQRRFNWDGIETYTDLILALPGETYDSFTNGVDRIIDNGQHNRIQFINLSILPNSEMGEPEYQKKHGMEIVESKIINIHGSLNGPEDGIEEVQDLVVGTRSMPKEDWVKTRAYSWMMSFLFFDKLMQIPMFLLHKFRGISYRNMVERFLEASAEKYPVLAELSDFFVSEAVKVQQGELEFCRSVEWLNIYWPHDEYAFIKICVENKFDQFFREAKALLGEILKKGEKPISGLFEEAVDLNLLLIKRPFMAGDVVLRVHHNIWESYVSALKTGKIDYSAGDFAYRIDRTSQAWNHWDDWLREVVWYGNKKGAYLYGLKSVGK